MRTILLDGVRPGETTLSPRESHHLLNVLRAAPGDVVRVTDGSGVEAEAVVVAGSAGVAVLRVGHPVRRAPPPTRIVLLGLPRPALVEETLILGTELGATAFWLTRCEHAHPGDTRVDRLDRVLDGALKQCRRTDRPLLLSYASLDDALAALPPAPRFVGEPGGPPAPRDTPLPAAVLAIGPEGGWHLDELERLVGAGFHPLGLGPNILRAPTAVAAGLTALMPTDADSDRMIAVANAAAGKAGPTSVSRHVRRSQRS